MSQSVSSCRDIFEVGDGVLFCVRMIMRANYIILTPLWFLHTNTGGNFRFQTVSEKVVFNLGCTYPR
jgi:hypothetical protein